MSSIETVIAENTKAMVNLTEALNKSNDLNERMIGLKAEAIETVKQTASKPDAAPKAAARGAVEKPEVKTEAAPEVKTETAPEVKAEEKPMDPIAEAISNYVATGYDAADPKAAEERAARSAKVKEIFKAIATRGSIEVNRHSDIPESFHGSFLKTLAKRVEEGNLVIGKTSDDLLVA